MNGFQTTARRSLGWLVTTVVLLVTTWSPGARALTVLNFEDLTPGTTVIAQYGPRGVLFNSAYLDTDPVAHSGARVLRSVPPTSEIFTVFPFVINFTSPQARVKLFAGWATTPINGTLTAFDANSAVVAKDGPRAVGVNAFTTAFEVTAPAAVIMRVELQYENSAFEAIDDLEFDGTPAATVPTEPPVVKVLSPASGDRDLEQFDITGTVTGEGLLSPVTLTVQSLRPPESTAPPFTSVTDLLGTGTTRTFELAISGSAPLGPVTVTASATNTGGLTGVGTSSFTNLPAAIRNRATAEGGSALLGAFRFGLFLAGCKMAVYEHAAITTDGSNATRIIRDPILTKWLSIKGTFNETGNFGCPLGEERDGPTGSRAQDFTGGRIFATPNGPFYVPAVFTNAIDIRGQENAMGVPLSDPTSSVGAMKTWLFQQFTRPEHPELLPSTLEIRGTPPALWIQRQGGDLSLPVVPLATLSDSFPCTDNLGPCQVTPEEPFPPENISNAGALFCGNTTYWPGHIGGPPEWVPVPSFNGDYDAIPVFGVILSAFMADIDNVFTHETHNANCPYFPDTIFGATLPIGVFAPTCASDFEFKIRPIGPQPGAFPRPSLFGKENTDRIKVEYEEFYAADAQNFFGAPAAGDLVKATGRWIIDCGHGSYKSELHPIFSYAKMKTLNSEVDRFTGIEHHLSFLAGDQMATRADIWVSGWYPGLNPIEIDIFPPPRPSPDSVLHVVKPPDVEAIAGDVTLQFQFAPAGFSNHVHLKFTAPFRKNEVTDAGEMKWEYGRGYLGKWYLFWGT
jgi:hypothetical protein